MSPWCMCVDYQIWLMVQMKFMSPSAIMAKSAEMEQFMKQFSLNGIHNPNTCKPD